MKLRTDPSYPTVKQKQSSIINFIFGIIVSIIKKSSILCCAYFIAFYKWSILWLAIPVIGSVTVELLMEHNEMKRKLNKKRATTNDQDLILSQYNELPTWLFFPDVERAEWCNKIIKQLWPFLNSYVRIFIEEILQPRFKENLEQYMLKAFHFKNLNLGSIPPRITGVKVYDQSFKSEIIIDVNIFYGGDCDCKLSVSGLSGGMKDFQIEGVLRIILKPLVHSFPLVGGFQIFFIDNPELDFSMVGATAFLDMPGIKNKFKRTIENIISSTLVIPNMLCFEFTEESEMAYLKLPDPYGVLRVHVVEATNLIAQDMNGKSDPYAVLQVGGQIFKTQTIFRTLNPTWDYWCEFIIDELQGQRLRIILWDEDYGKADDPLGNTSVDISTIMNKKFVDTWLTLEEVEHGMIHLTFFWFSLSSRTQDIELIVNHNNCLRGVSLNSAVLVVFIDSAIDLPVDDGDPPDAFVKLRVNSSTKTTSICRYTIEPRWKEGFCFLIRNPTVDKLELRVINATGERDIGRLDYHFKELLLRKNLKFEKESFQLSKSGPNSRIVWSVRMHIMKINSMINSRIYSFVSRRVFQKLPFHTCLFTVFRPFEIRCCLKQDLNQYQLI